MEKADGADLLYGAPAISDFLRLRERQTRHLIEKGFIPTFKIGKTVCASRSALSSYLREQERKASPRGPVGTSAPAEGQSND